MLLVVLAAVGAGTINTIIGSGTLITFPTLLLLGVPPVTANMSNSVGLVAGGATGAFGYRREIAGSVPSLLRLVPASFVGAVVGALLLLVLDPAAFNAIVPVLILLGIVLVLTGPRLSRAAAGHRGGESGVGHRMLLNGGVFLTGVYGGYFGAAQGVILMGILSILTSEPLQRLNGWKNVLATVANGVAAVVFIVVAGGLIDWPVAGLIAVGAILGGILGSRIGRRLPPPVLRGVITVVGIIAIVKVVWFP